MKASIMRAGIAAMSLAYAVQSASGQATSLGLSVRAVAEVQAKASDGGRQIDGLVSAQRVSPGDEVVYTLEIRNTGPATVHAPVVVYPVPAHTMYVADTATGPGADVSYSIDGGHRFAYAESLKASDEGRARPAKAGDYTHIRWKLKNDLQPNSVAFARFRAIVK